MCKNYNKKQIINKIYTFPKTRQYRNLNIEVYFHRKVKYYCKLLCFSLLIDTINNSLKIFTNNFTSVKIIALK